MRFSRIINIIVCIIFTIASFGEFTTQGSTGEATATAQSSKKKSSKKSSSSKKKKSRSSSKKKKKSSSSKSKKKKKSRSKSKSKSKRSKSKNRKKRRNVARTVYKEAPKEVAQNDSLTLSVNAALLSRIPKHLDPGGLRINSVKPDKSKRQANVGLNDNFTYMPLSRNVIDSLGMIIKESLPDSLRDYSVYLRVGSKPLTYYIHTIDKLPEQYRHNPDFVKEVHPVVRATRGMDNDIIAMWHSHGRYYSKGAWAWQRPFLFETAEDVYTMGYILPYVVPMLENAGAYVMLPRERDPNPNEVIVDNDTNDEGQIFSQPYYKEMSGHHKWETGEYEGFIYDLPDFRDTENPFENGTYRQVATQRRGSPSVAAWYADIPEDGEYAIYVSYKTLPNSTTDARYTVNYSGGSKEYKVNQTMGGGTWIYLGTFPLESGYSDVEPVVTLTNLTEGNAGTIVTADAIKIGGGMGNIARSPYRKDIYYDPSTPDKSVSSPKTQDVDDEESGDDEEDEEDEGDDEEDEGDEESETGGDDITDTIDQPQSKDAAKEDTSKKGPAPRFSISGMPRFVEGARYWLHWAGYPEYVYSPYHGSDDYKDDYTSRGHWVNYLAGGSRVLPDADGLNIPVDAVFALHSDAGKRDNDTYVGTLGIYFTQNGTSYADGTPRINSRMLTNLIMTQICNDIRKEYEPNWTRRSMWDKSYVEARVPEVPTTLIELMSHQNYADMMYGLDPNFRFTVGRAIYKGIARFMAERKGRKLVIQPLPVSNFMIKRTKADHYRLSWAPTPDKLEPTAMPSRYVIMERSGEDLGFHKIGETGSTHFDIKVTDHDIHSFYVIATNEGGASFPSETLAIRESSTGQKPALIVNGFTRVSGPGHHAESGNAGFDSESDFGVPYVRDISFTGHQNEFRRSAGNNFGLSYQNYITKVIAGNTFDYTAIHGRALAAADPTIGFVSSSIGAVESGEYKLSDYFLVDMIMGKQKSTEVGKGYSGVHYKTFSETIQKQLRQYVDKGGNLMVSGEYIISDLNTSRSSESDRRFAAEILGSEAGESDTSKSGTLRDCISGKKLSYSSTLNSKQYIVERPDVLLPCESATTTEFLRFGMDDRRAGHIVDRGKGEVAVMTIPLESLSDNQERALLVKEILKLLDITPRK